MSDTLSQDIPRKRCRTCEQPKLATKDFFSAVPAYVSLDLLSSQCKVCRSDYRKQNHTRTPKEPRRYSQGIVEIPLTKGRFTIVDLCDEDLFNGCEWSYGDRTTPNAKRKRYNGESGYAKRQIVIDGMSKTIRLQWLIMERILGEPIPDDCLVDHRNGNPLDNRRENLRLATPIQNAWNADKEGNHTNPYKGVSYDNSRKPRIKRWAANICVDGKHRHLGRFHTPEEAAIAYNEAALKYYGEFAKLNDVAS